MNITDRLVNYSFSDTIVAGVLVGFLGSIPNFFMKGFDQAAITILLVVSACFGLLAYRYLLKVGNAGLVRLAIVLGTVSGLCYLYTFIDAFLKFSLGAVYLAIVLATPIIVLTAAIISVVHWVFSGFKS